VVSPEPHRSTVNTAILVVAVAAATGSLLALVLGSVWLGVLRQDIQEWRERGRLPWKAHHYAPDVVSSMLQELRAVHGTDDSAITAAGMPCLAVRLEPRTVADAERKPFEDAEVTCFVARRAPVIGLTRKIKVPVILLGGWNASGRWPDEWFDVQRVAPRPGHYRVRWEVRTPTRGLERPEQVLIVGTDGQERERRRARAADWTQATIRHFRGLEDDPA
jgi:hypothetical protein